MKVRVSDGPGLGAGEIARWREIQAAAKDFASPYLCPEFHAAVAASRPGVRLAILEEGGRIEGFFPYQIVKNGAAEAVGDKVSDCHAVIATHDLPWTVEDLLRGAGLHSWHYRHVISSQSQFDPFHTEHLRSPLVDLSEGYDAYAAARERAGSRVLGKIAVMKDKLERAAGPLRYEAQCSDPATLHALMRCKSRQYQKTGQPDRFAIPWVVALMERLHAARDAEFAGMLSVLWAGDRMAAAHFGMRSRTIWNYWFPCYDPRFAAFSPGLILLAEILRSAAQMGIRIVEMGAGIGQYKDRFANSERTLARGVATL
jgi:CelD/BcsL family acetyltransferase involved in cellulose biosynthesis